MNSLSKFLMAVALLSLAGCSNGAGGNNTSSNSTSSSSSSTTKSVKLLAGKLDTATVLQADPEYMSLAQEYLREQTELRSKTAKEAEKIRGDKDAMETLQRKFTTELKELDKKWMGKTQEFLTTRHTKMKSIVEEICKDKKLDIVVIDSRQFPTVEWGGFDITQDVLLKTQGGGAPVNSASPTPK